MAESTLPWSDADAQAQSLQGRLQHLETVVAGLQDTQALEDRVAERVAARLGATVTTEVERMVTADQRPTSTAMMAAAGDALRAAATPVGQTAGRMPLLAVDLYQELFAISRMFFDLHYKVGWGTRLF